MNGWLKLETNNTHRIEFEYYISFVYLMAFTSVFIITARRYA